ncbi:MAG: DUF2145 domain-containing protein [Ottowia sp.]
MKPFRHPLTLLTMFTALVCAAPAHAGRSCEPVKLTVATIDRGMQLAQRTAQALDAAYAKNGTRVVLLARAGQDLSQYDQYWSHVAWAYRTPQGPWRVVHKLNTCGTATSILMRQGLGDFFLDNMWRYEAAWAALPADLQTPMWALVQNKQRVGTLHQRRYSMVSYAWGQHYQQSNQWAAETLAMAAEPGLRRREQAQSWLKLRDYRPAVLRIGALTRLGGRLTSSNIEFDDHPPEQRFAGRIETVTADSLFQWITRSLPGAGPKHLIH